MREIKFQVNPKGTNVVIPLAKQDLHRYQKRGDNLMQFTGLHDVHGKEIYEGNIVKWTRKHWYCPGHPEHDKDLVDNVEIYFDDEDGVISGRIIDLTRKNQPPYSSSGVLTRNFFIDERADKNVIAVIGNIYENPELLNP